METGIEVSQSVAGRARGISSWRLSAISRQDVNWAWTLLLLLLLLSRFSRVRLCATPYTAAHQAPRPWDSPGKNTGVGCHFLLQGMKVKSESEVAQSRPTLSDPMDCSPPGSSTHGIFQARVLEWGAIAFSGTLLTILKEKSGNPLLTDGKQRLEVKVRLSQLD